MQSMATTSLNLLQLPFPSPPLSLSSSSSRLLRPQIPNAGDLSVCRANKGCFNVEVVIEDDEPSDLLLRHFQREVFRAGIPREWRRRMHHENSKDIKMRKDAEQSRMRARQRMMRRGGGGRSGGGKRDYGDDDEQIEEGGALAKLMDTDYQEGNIEVLNEFDFRDEVFDDDGEAFPIHFD
ncbi:hypothetical protein LUZ60_017124 [Juncus effusus]|nr:hypothetical protein LUZ60_017124 [Juncus effusus]